MSYHQIIDNSFLEWHPWIKWNYQNDTFVINFLLVRWRGLSNGLSNLDNYLILFSLYIPEIQMTIIKWNLTINLTMGYGYSNVELRFKTSNSQLNFGYVLITGLLITFEIHQIKQRARVYNYPTCDYIWHNSLLLLLLLLFDKNENLNYLTFLNIHKKKINLNFKDTTSSFWKPDTMLTILVDFVEAPQIEK
jgi:hypothetical protein